MWFFSKNIACLTQLSMKFQLLAKGKMVINKGLLSEVVNSLLITIANGWHFNNYMCEKDEFHAQLNSELRMKKLYSLEA